MAFYPFSSFPPGHRLAYERDGSGVYAFRANGAPNHPSEAQKAGLNNEQSLSSFGFSSFAILGVVFPVPVHLVGFYKAGGSSIRFVEVSSDTTDLQDGTWTQIIDDTAVIGQVNPPILTTYREFITVLSETNVKGVRVLASDGSTEGLHAMHIYVASQETFLQVWHPTLDQEIDPEDFDWGVVFAGEVYDRQFRIKNVRSMTAQSIEVTNLSYTNTSIDTAYDFSIDGGAFQRPLAIGNLGPGAISDVITQRLTLPDAQTVTRYSTQISAIPASWSG